jgi:hypothetical protein
MNRWHDLSRVLTMAFGFSYLIAIVLLGELLGSAADSTATFADRVDDEALRAVDLLGCAFLAVSAVLLVMVALTLRRRIGTNEPDIWEDISAGVGLLAAAGLLMSAALLATTPLWRTLGAATDDPSLEPAVGAGITQAGIAMLILSVVVAGVWTVLVAIRARRTVDASIWFMVSAILVGALTLFAVTVAAALPLGVWWLAFAIGLPVAKQPKPLLRAAA